MGLHGNGQTMTLGECISMGISRNLSLLNARIDIEKSHTVVSQNRARLLPVINGVLQFTDYLVNPVNVTTGTLLGNDFPDNPSWQTIKSMPYNANVGVQLVVPLYNQAIFASIDVARTIENISALTYEKGVEELTVQISKVYYLAQTSREQVELLDRNIARMEELYVITKALYEQGVVMEIDLNRVNINLQNLKSGRGQYQMAYEQQLNMLRFLLDLPSDTELILSDMPDSIHWVETAGIDTSLPEIVLAQKQRELAEKRIKTIKAGYIPTLSFSAYAGGVGYQEKFGNFFHSRAATHNWFGNCFIGFNVSVPIFDANTKKLQIKQQRSDYMQAENKIDLLQKQIRERYDSAILQLNHSREVYETQTQSYRQAEDVYDITESRYREGVASMTELLQDEMQLRMAQSSCVQAHCQFNIAQLELLRLSGNLAKLSE